MKCILFSRYVDEFLLYIKVSEYFTQLILNF
jgi:hypothetical protein